MHPKLRSHLVPAGLLVLLATLAASAPARAAGALDGRSFAGALGAQGKAKGDADRFRFERGAFHSTACDAHGFASAPYTTSVAGDEIRFRATTSSPTEGTMEWSGTVLGGKLEGTIVKRKGGGAPQSMWFRGDEQGGGAGAGGTARDAVYHEIEQMFGLVPAMFKLLPDSTLELEWRLFKASQFDPGPIPNKYRELIGLGLSAIAKCQYCIAYHTEVARLNGATDAELEDAVHFAKSSAGWSTYLNGMQVDLDQFKREVRSAVAYARAHAQPAEPAADVTKLKGR